MANEPDAVKLKQLVESLASVMVVTNRYLDQATTEMYNLYAQSENGLLASLAPARYSLDEVTFELAFVIDEVGVVDVATELAEPTGSLDLTPKDYSNQVKAKLAAVTRQEEKTQQNYRDGQQRFEQYQSQLLAFNKAQPEFRSTVATLNKVAGSSFAMAQQQPAALPAFIPDLKKIQIAFLNLSKTTPEDFGKLLQEYAAFVGEMQQRFTVASNYPPRNAMGLMASTAGELQNLLKKSPNPPSEVDPPAPVPEPRNYSALWEQFEQDYLRAKELCQQVHAKFKQRSPLGQLDVPPPQSPVLKKAIKQAKLPTTLAKAVDRLTKDYDATRGMINEVVQAIAAAIGQGVHVRVDPQAIEAAPETARQRMKLTFRSESQETVQVGDQSVNISQ